jgi:hypothetical protein
MTCSTPTALVKVLKQIVLVIHNIIFLLPLTWKMNVVISSPLPLPTRTSVRGILVQAHTVMLEKWPGTLKGLKLGLYVIYNLSEVCLRIPLKTDLRLVYKMTCSLSTALG